jgi:hypothetical protein
VGFHWSYVYCIWYVVRYVCICHWIVTEVRLLAISLLMCHSNCTWEQNTAKCFTESKIRLPTHESWDYLRRRKIIVFLSVGIHTARLVLHILFIWVFIYGNWTKIFDLSQRNVFITSGQQHTQSAWLGGGTVAYIFEDYKLWSPALLKFIHPPVTASFFGLNL